MTLQLKARSLRTIVATSILCVMTLSTSAYAQQGDEDGGDVYAYPALAAFALTNDTAHHHLERIVRPRDVITHHHQLHVMYKDARRRVKAKHWVFPTARSISRVVTHNGVVLVHDGTDKQARILPTLSLSTVGARVRVHF